MMNDNSLAEVRHTAEEIGVDVSVEDIQNSEVMRLNVSRDRGTGFFGCTPTTRVKVQYRVDDYACPGPLVVDHVRQRRGRLIEKMLDMHGAYFSCSDST